jgi:RNA polymerase sigma-70 factor (ECF subfamily)
VATVEVVRYDGRTVNDVGAKSLPKVHRDMLAHVDALYNLARHLTRDAGHAEDLVQETFIRALRAVPETREGYLKPWLFRILRNVFYDMRRRGKKQPTLESLDVDATVIDGSSRRDAELELLSGVAARELEAAVEKLPDDARTVLLLDVEGFTESEIADIMQCPVGTVKSRLMRARANLRKQLCQHGK